MFAYGQTGSGKTYTMSGREEVIGKDSYRGDTHDGIVSRSVSYLYQQIQVGVMGVPVAGDGGASGG